MMTVDTKAFLLSAIRVKVFAKQRHRLCNGEEFMQPAIDSARFGNG